MAEKQRYQNPVVEDTVILRLFTYNSHNSQDVFNVEKVDIYFLDCNNKSCDNPDGRCLIETIDGSLVTRECTGEYLVSLPLPHPQYQVGKYIDVWTLNVIDGEPLQVVTNYFEIYPQLWYTTPIPIVYDFSFKFQPNRIRKGSKQFLIIEVIPNVPSARDLQRYYENLAILGNLNLTIVQACGSCEVDEDLRTVVDDECVSFREKRFGYYQLDTAELDCGIYDLTFKLETGGNIYLSDKQQLLIYN